VLTEQIKLWESELQYLESVQAFLAKPEREEDLDELREELYRSGYSQKLKSYKPKKSIKLQPIELTTSGGYKLLVGRNNIQNDHLTFKVASKDDIWFHVKDMPGSHVIMLAAGEEPDERDYTEAAETAAYYSKATAGPVTVDYTRVKNVKKPSGSRPGFVIYDNYKTTIAALK
jgi:predicted ribosome quality control (RQC) complex YloA/Tae2 family protein